MSPADSLEKGLNSPPAVREGFLSDEDITPPPLGESHDGSLWCPKTCILCCSALVGNESMQSVSSVQIKIPFVKLVTLGSDFPMRLE